MLTDNMIHKWGGSRQERAEAAGLHQEPFNRLLDGLDLLLELGAFFDGNRTGDDRSGDPTGPS